MKKLTKILLAFLLVFNFTAVFAFWVGQVASANSVSLALVEVGEFDFLDCSNKIYVIDDAFYLKYFHLKNGELVWRNNLTQTEVDIITQITKDYDFIKTDKIYRIREKHYNLLYNDLPFKDEYNLAWAVEPTDLEVVAGWSYFTGRVITFNGILYRAYYRIDNTPAVFPYAWERINPLKITDFEKYQGSCVVNYNHLKSQESIRPYWWSSQAKYLEDDLVSYNNIEYICLEQNMGSLPTNSIFWERA